MNYLLDHKHLSNRYFAMRHGHSLANQEGIIVSHPENGVDGYGLSERGVAQVENSVLTSNPLGPDTLIISSDFKRARESAEIVHRLLKCLTPICFDQRLRERNFGGLELKSDSNYSKVWRADETNPDSRIKGVESVSEVMERVSAMVFEYENKLNKATLLFISHGDALQILQTAFSKQSASRHKYQKHLETAEIRRLNLMPGVDRS